MNAISRWEPLTELEELQNRLTNIFGRSPVRKKDGQQEGLTVAAWAPLVDISEDDKEYTIKAELPGLRKEDVKITVENGVLVISGERQEEKEEKNKRFHRIERAYGAFVRSFTLPDNADAEKVQAEFRNGMLLVHLPKTERAQAKQVQIQGDGGAEGQSKGQAPTEGQGVSQGGQSRQSRTAQAA